MSYVLENLNSINNSEKKNDRGDNYNRKDNKTAILATTTMTNTTANNHSSNENKTRYITNNDPHKQLQQKTSTQITIITTNTNQSHAIHNNKNETRNTIRNAFLHYKLLKECAKEEKK